MKRILFLCFTCVLFAFSGCSGDDDESRASSSLDASLLPGYWIMVKDGVRTNHGVWFSDGTDPQSSEDLKSVTYFYLTDTCALLTKVSLVFKRRGHNVGERP